MSTAKPFQFEAALKELEEITAWFESSDVDLDAGLAKFERGMELSTQLKEHLQAVENRVEKIKAKFAPGAKTEPDSSQAAAPAAIDQPQSRPFSDDEASLGPDQDDSQTGLF
jgi:exodeoxyribonuclease VII small subunit